MDEECAHAYENFLLQHHEMVSGRLIVRLSDNCGDGTRGTVAPQTCPLRALQDLRHIVQADNQDICQAIRVSLVELASVTELAASALLQDPLQQLQLFDQAALAAQQRLLAAGGAR